MCLLQKCTFQVEFWSLLVLSVQKVCSFLACSSIVEEKHIISSKYTRQSIPFSPIKTTSIHRWYVAGALLKPNGILIYWKWPLWQENTVFSRCSGFMAIWWHPDAISSTEKILLCPSESKVSTMFGMGYASGFVTAFKYPVIYAEPVFNTSVSWFLLYQGDTAAPRLHTGINNLFF